MYVSYHSSNLALVDHFELYNAKDNTFSKLICDLLCPLIVNLDLRTTSDSSI